MRGLFLSTALVLGLSSTALTLAGPASAQTPAAQTPAAQPAAQSAPAAAVAKPDGKAKSYKNDDEVVCEDVSPTGSHMSTRYCNTRGNLRLQQQQAQDAMSDSQGGRQQVPHTGFGSH